MMKKLKKTISGFLAMLMLLGNPVPYLAVAVSPAVRNFAGTFLAAWVLAAKRAIADDGTHHVADTGLPDFTADPSDEEFLRVKCFDFPLAPTSADPSEGENAGLAHALRAAVEEPGDETLDHLGSFAETYPQGRWVLSVQLNRGMILYRRGHFSLALEAFRSAWEAGKDETALETKNMADRALAELLRMDARVGRMEEMSDLIGLMRPRRPQGIAGRYYEQARDAYWYMENDPGKVFFCGPYALRSILSFQGSPQANDPLFISLESPQSGFSLEQVLGFSGQLEMGLQAAKRTAGSEFVVPSVVHLKLDHYAALLEEKDGMYLLVDPTFGNDTWMSVEALEGETSGYFLVPGGGLPNGWAQVPGSEAATVWGKGLTRGTEPPPPTCSGGGGHGPTLADSCNTCDDCPKGMPVANIDLGQVAAVLFDIPLSYQPPVGPEVALRLVYHQKTPQPLFGSNFGPNFSFKWQAYIQYDYSGCPGQPANYLLVPPGGGQESFTALGTSTKYSRSVVDSDQLFGSGTGCLEGRPSSFARRMPDGSVETYGRAVTTLSRVRALLTEYRDPQGNTLSFDYDGENRLIAVVDALGQSNTFEYDPAALPGTPAYFRITRVNDPFGRHADFTYDVSGRLGTVTDQLGLTSSFTYDPPSALSSDWIGSMTTPYGTTTFDYVGSNSATDGTDRHELEVTDPEGQKQHALFLTPQTPDDVNAPIPTGLPPSNEGQPYSNLHHARNTFYWDRKAMAEAPLAAGSAAVYHWLHTPDSKQSMVLESMKKPLESRIWYGYANQGNIVFETGAMMPPEPVLVARILRDATGAQGEQKLRYTYNSFGKPITFIDPKGRVFSYQYSADGIDLLSTKADSDTISSSTYNGQHLPLAVTDAAGKTTIYTYNAQGQVRTVTTPEGEVTTYNYDALDRLESIVPPQPGAGVTFTYDSFVTYRVKTRSDAASGTLIYSYDAADRVTRVDYPDNSFEQYTYDKLDMETYRDRDGRVTVYDYDNVRRLTSVTDPKGQTTTLGWCSCGSMQSLTDPKGNQTRWDYDVASRLARKTYADGSFYKYEYELSGTRLAFMTDAKGQITRYRYDLDDKLIGQDYFNEENHTPNVSFSYSDPLGRLTSMTDGTGTHLYDYWPFGATGGGRLRSIQQPIGTTSAAITYVYDDDGRVVSRSIDGVAETYAFNNGQLTNVLNPLGNFTYNYSPADARLSSVAYPNGQSVTFGYYTPTDPLGSGRLKNITNLGAGATAGQILSKFDYQYNPAGEITQWVKQLGNNAATDTQTMTLGYDDASQLTNADTVYSDGAPSKAATFGYDLAGNRTLEEVTTTGPDSFSNSFGTNNLNQLTNITPNPHEVKGVTNRSAAVTVNGQHVAADGSLGFETELTPAPGATTPLTVTAVAEDGTVTQEKKNILNTQPFVYDANGNLIRDNEKEYGWDAMNRLVRVSFLSPQPEGKADTVLFSYDGNGRRVGITEKHGSAVLSDKRFVWCKGPQPCEERNSIGTIITKRFYEDGLQKNSGIDAGIYFYTKDHLDSVRELVDSAGTIQSQVDYDSWGRKSKLISNSEMDFGFVGFLHHEETGLEFAWHRAYDADKGRWLSRDPVGETIEDFNLYGYVQNLPSILTDSLGLAVDPGPQPRPTPTPPKTPAPSPGSPTPPYKPTPTPCPTESPKPCTNWVKKGWFRVFNFICRCQWLCVPPGGTIWSGNVNELPTTGGVMIFTGKDPESGDDCLCPPPS